MVNLDRVNLCAKRSYLQIFFYLALRIYNSRLIKVGSNLHFMQLLLGHFVPPDGGQYKCSPARKITNKSVGRGRLLSSAIFKIVEKIGPKLYIICF